jgi:hypothetical protein
MTEPSLRLVLNGEIANRLSLHISYRGTKWRKGDRTCDQQGGGLASTRESAFANTIECCTACRH